MKNSVIKRTRMLRHKILNFIGMLNVVCVAAGVPAVSDAAQLHDLKSWTKMKEAGFLLEMSDDPSFSSIVQSGDMVYEKPRFWRWKTSSGSIYRHPGVALQVSDSSDGVWLELGSDSTPASQWQVAVQRLDGADKASDSDRFFRFRGTAVLLSGAGGPWLYRVFPSDQDRLSRQTSGFSGLRVSRLRKTGAANFEVTEVLYPEFQESAPQVALGPLTAIVDPRDPTRETVSSFRFLGKVLTEDLNITRDLNYSVSGGKSIGGALRLEDVSFYPASIFADFEWHGVGVTYRSETGNEPPEVIKHVFGGLSVGYDIARFWAESPEGFALHVGPQIGLVSVPVTRDFEPRGFVGIRIQPQWIQLGALWYGSLQYAPRGDGLLSYGAAGYMNCKVLNGFCFSSELYRRGLALDSGSNTTDMTETGVAAGIGANL
jgi:hypothetical protein